MKILLSVDGSSYTKKMLAYLVTHDEVFHTNNEFTVLTVQPPIPNRASAAVGKEVVEDYYTSESAKVISPVQKFLLRHGINAKTAIKVGQIGETIGKFADDGKFDMLIMGSHGNGSFVNMVMGSVATRVLANSKTPVLLIR